MGNDQSIPPHRMEEPRYPVWRSGTGKLPRDKASPRSLFWRLLSGCTIRLEVNVALCFGDVCRVLMVLHDDDAELDHHQHNSPLGCHRHLLPARHQRLQLVEGLPAPGQGRQLPRAIFAGAPMGDARQICQHSGLQYDSTLHVVIPEQTAWRALPRGLCEAGGRDSDGGGWLLGGRWRQWWRGSESTAGSGWALPAGWDDGLSDVIANHGSLQISGRANYIRACLLKIVEHEGLRLVGQGDETQTEMVDQLMKGITDDINNPPLNFFVALRAPAEATIYHGSDINSSTATEPGTMPELVVHVQLSPLYPLARERCRMLTPILHPLVTPLLDLTDADNKRSDEASVERQVVDNGPGRQPSIHEAGRMAFLLPKGVSLGFTKSTLAELLAWFRDKWLVDPVACAHHFAETHPLDATPTAVLKWITDSDEMTRRARCLAALGEGGPRWRPELHAVCPRAFRAEVRLLLLARQRGDNIVAALPVEVVWHIIDALLRLHIASGSLFFQ